MYRKIAIVIAIATIISAYLMSSPELVCPPVKESIDFLMILGIKSWSASTNKRLESPIMMAIRFSIK